MPRCRASRCAVFRTSQPTANVTIGLSSSDLTEGTVAPGSVTFTPGNWNMAQTVTVTGVDDFGVDGNVPYTIVTAAATSTDGSYNGLNRKGVGEGKREDLGGGRTIKKKTGRTKKEGGGKATLKVG